jgi:hypothetical protein
LFETLRRLPKLFCAPIQTVIDSASESLTKQVIT